MRVAIIGAGIGGLAAAVALRRVGIEAVVIERSTSIREIGAGLSIWSNAVNAQVVLDYFHAHNAAYRLHLVRFYALEPALRRHAHSRRF